MDAKPNRSAIAAYLDGARRAIESAQFNLDGGYYGVVVNRAYYAFFYAATAVLLALGITRNKHSGVLAAFRKHLVKPGIFPVQDSRAYGEAFELRNVIDYEMLGQADKEQASALFQYAIDFLAHCQAYLSKEGYL